VPVSRTHVLIDLDGTISNSFLGISRSLVHAFEACGYDTPADERIRSMIGPPFELTFPRMGVPADDIERVVDAYRERYDDVGLFENEVYAGVPAMLTELEEAGFTLAVATAKPEHLAIRIIEHFGLAGHFAVNAGATTVVGSSRRTKAAVITYALGELGIDAGRHVVMLGDRAHDVEGATTNGIDCVGVTWGFGSRAELVDAGATAVVDAPRDVVAAVRGSYRSDPS
jgi:phosphoglycolate phosphatase